MLTTHKLTTHYSQICRRVPRDQKRAIMQNKPNLPNTKMNVTSFITMNYEQWTINYDNKNKAKQTQPVVSLSNLSGYPSMPFLAFTFSCSIYNLAMQDWTIQKLLNWITGYFTDKGIDSPRLSAELLLSNVLGLERIRLYTDFDKQVGKEQLDELHGLVKRAGQHEPIAYLTGMTEFYSLKMTVTPACMIPRPETELLTERAIEFLRERTGKQFVCDLCTGCGCIAIAIAKNFPEADIIATDISDVALGVAAKNVEKHKLNERVTLLQGDLFDPIIPYLDTDKFDLITCNPPYVSAAEYEKLDKNIKDYEPKEALFAGEDGLDIYRRIAGQVNKFLKGDGGLMLEVGYDQGEKVCRLLEQRKNFAGIKIEKDLHKNDRLIIARQDVEN